MRGLSCNIERNRHLDRLIPFIQQQDPDVLCVQELYEPNQDLFSGLQKWSFSCITYMTVPNGFEYPQALAVFSKMPVLSHKVHMLGDFTDELEIPYEKPRNSHTVNWKVIEINYKTIDVFVLHAPVAAEGDQVTEYQKLYLAKLLRLLSKSKKFVLCGDLNSARGADIWDGITEQYQDNIPSKYQTSIDNDLHYAGYKNLQHVVDCCFSHNTTVLDAQYHSGLSDHFALTFEIEDK